MLESPGAERCYLTLTPYSLARRFVEKKFFTDELPTIGFDFKPLNMMIDGEMVQFNIWVLSCLQAPNFLFKGHRRF